MRFSTLLLPACLICAATAPAQVGNSSMVRDRYVGSWEGSLVAGPVRLRLRLVMRADTWATGLSSVVTSLDQDNAIIPATTQLAGDTLYLVMPSARATYRAVVSARGDSLLGMWSQGLTLSLNMVRGAAAPTVALALSPAARPQDPRPPFPYSTRDVSIASVPGVRLSGTLTMPQGRGPFPAVLMIPGSGPHDRNETVLGHRPFLVMADFLARRGIASLRVDDRGVGMSTGMFNAATTADLATDAEAGFAFLRAAPAIAATCTGLIGHSEGGLIGSMLAARNANVASVVLLGSPSVRGDSTVILQARALGAASGATAGQIDATIEVDRRLFAVLLASLDSVDAVPALQRTRDTLLASVPADRRVAAAARLDQAVAPLSSPWAHYFIKYDPRPALRRLRVPVLALNGMLDLQVPYREHLAALDSALHAAGNHDYKVVALPRLNHLFQTAVTGLPTEYATIDETLAPQVLELVSSWLLDHCTAR
jgi:pimeloyl-ACP methyl ester carboxylesterase